MAKPSPEELPGTGRDQRVFVGGQYDFMPTLRQTASFIEDAPSDVLPTEARLFPVIPFDYEIEVEETMDRAVEILDRCAYAIFDLSDLGAQLIEMQEAKQKHTSIKTLLVYPVRETGVEPERGRRTIQSFGLPHFGYTTFDELRGIVHGFLAGVSRESTAAARRA
jgi:hypothetical protein